MSDSSMKTVYKYPLQVVDRLVVTLPAGSRILTIQAQDDVPCIWAVVNQDTDKLELRDFRIIGTGHPFPDEWPIYVGTFQLMGGRLVFHVFTREPS